MTLTKRAVWVIERNLSADLSLAGVADACGVSRHHLAHAFGDALGVGVMAYLRRRRLSEAARALAAGAGNILDLGLEAGYGSHEAFTRAFRAQFGATPAAVRRRASIAGLALVEAASIATTDASPSPPPRLVERGAIRLTGLAERASFAAPEAIPALWRQFMPMFGDIAGMAEPIPLGVLANIDAEGAFTYLCAAEVSVFGETPKGLARMTLPPQTYAVFRHDDHVVTLRRTYSAIWDHWLPQRGWTTSEGAILERHNESFDTDTGLGGLEIWAPIVK